MSDVSCRLCLYAPSGEPAAVAGALDAALKGGDVACVILPADANASALAAACAPLTQPRGVALLASGAGPTDVPRDADGLHMTAPSERDLAAAIKRLRPDGMVGAGGFDDRHAALLAGELEPDYVMFGTPQAGIAGDVELVRWWAALFNVPVIAVIADIADAGMMAGAGAEFVAAGDPVWRHPEGPAAAVAAINAALSETEAA